jgi:hypothetical protein
MDYRDTTTTDVLPTTLRDTIDLLKREHASRAVRAHTLGMTLAVGALFWLQSILTSVSPEIREYFREFGWLIQWAFVCAGVSIVAGAIHVFLDMLLPLRVASLLESAIQKGVNLASPKSQDHICKRQDAYLLWGVPAVSHFLFLLLSFVFGLSYRLAIWTW